MQGKVQTELMGRLLRNTRTIKNNDNTISNMQILSKMYNKWHSHAFNSHKHQATVASLLSDTEEQERGPATAGLSAGKPAPPAGSRQHGVFHRAF